MPTDPFDGLEQLAAQRPWQGHSNPPQIPGHPTWGDSLWQNAWALPGASRPRCLLTPRQHINGRRAPQAIPDTISVKHQGNPFKAEKIRLCRNASAVYTRCGRTSSASSHCTSSSSWALAPWRMASYHETMTARDTQTWPRTCAPERQHGKHPHSTTQCLMTVPPSPSRSSETWRLSRS